MVRDMLLSPHPFDLLMELDDTEINLDCALLHAARDAFPHLDLAPYLEHLDALAAEVAAEKPGLSSVLRYEALQRVLVERHGFAGNADAYYDPENSYLNRVLERRVGIPISLSVVWLEVGRRLKWNMAGIAFPGHFLVRIDDTERLVVVDPFHDGRSLSMLDCRQLLADVTLRKEFPYEDSPIPTLRPEHLQACSTRTILARALHNLRVVYTARSEWSRLDAVLHRLAALEPMNGSHLCELASLHARLGDWKRAYAHLAVYLEKMPDADDAAQVRNSLRLFERALLAQN